MNSISYCFQKLNWHSPNPSFFTRKYYLGDIQKLRWPNFALFWPLTCLMLTVVDIWQPTYPPIFNVDICDTNPPLTYPASKRTDKWLVCRINKYISKVAWYRIPTFFGCQAPILSISTPVVRCQRWHYVYTIYLPSVDICWHLMKYLPIYLIWST